MRVWGLTAVLVAACAGRGSAPPPEPGSPIEGCESAECRAETYRSMHRAGARALPMTGPGCGQVATPRQGCEPLHWCRVTVLGTSGNAFDETTVVVLLGSTEGSVRTASRLLEQSGSIDGEVGPAVLGSIRDEGVGAVVVERLLSVRERIGEGDEADALAPVESQRTQACTVVHVDVCNGSVGWVCTGTDLEQQAPGGGADGLFVFEMDLRGSREAQILSSER